MSGNTLLDALEGNWRFGRTVTLGITMQGTASFTRTAPNKLRYLEEGKILETRIEFTRAYDYIFEGADLTIFYADGDYIGTRFLYFPNLVGKSFPLSGKAEHLCGKDHYTADFTFASEAVFFTHYDVMGPDKMHGITTDYSKL